MIWKRRFGGPRVAACSIQRAARRGADLSFKKKMLLKLQSRSMRRYFARRSFVLTKIHQFEIWSRKIWCVTAWFRPSNVSRYCNLKLMVSENSFFCDKYNEILRFGWLAGWPGLDAALGLEWPCAFVGRPQVGEPLTSKWRAVTNDAMSLTVRAERMLFSIAGPFARMAFNSAMAAGGILYCSNKLTAAWFVSTTLNTIFLIIT